MLRSKVFLAYLFSVGESVEVTMGLIPDYTREGRYVMLFAVVNQYIIYCMLL